MLPRLGRSLNQAIAKASEEPIGSPRRSGVCCHGQNQEFTMILLEFSMSPMTKGDSVSAYVARSLDIIDKSGLSYQLTPMGTIIEGEWDAVMAVVTACFERMKADCPRISTQIKIDYRDAPAGRLASKVKAVEDHLGRKLST
jgi:uncharacterized protein (TIGR00106 family)